MSIDKAFIALFLAWVSTRTMLFAVYQWKQDNKTGGAGLIILGLLAFALPMAAVVLRF